MEATLADNIPVSGEYEEVCFECGNDNAWVKFQDSEYEEWYGVFGRGLSAHSKVILVGENSLCFVNAGGQGYWVDINSKKLISKTKDDYLENTIAVPRHELVICSDFTNILFYTPEGLVWDSGRVSMDGISFEEITENYVKGKINDLTDEGSPYVLQINERKYTCDWKVPGELA